MAGSCCWGWLWLALMLRLAEVAGWLWLWLAEVKANALDMLAVLADEAGLAGCPGGWLGGG